MLSKDNKTKIIATCSECGEGLSIEEAIDFHTNEITVEIQPCWKCVETQESIEDKIKKDHVSIDTIKDRQDNYSKKLKRIALKEKNKYNSLCRQSEYLVFEKSNNKHILYDTN